jgi:hypothetical protein
VREISIRQAHPEPGALTQASFAWVGIPLAPSTRTGTPGGVCAEKRIAGKSDEKETTMKTRLRILR